MQVQRFSYFVEIHKLIILQTLEIYTIYLFYQLLYLKRFKIFSFVLSCLETFSVSNVVQFFFQNEVPNIPNIVTMTVEKYSKYIPRHLVIHFQFIKFQALVLIFVPGKLSLHFTIFKQYIIVIIYNKLNELNKKIVTDIVMAKS